MADRLKISGEQKKFWKKYLSKNVRTARGRGISPGRVYIYNYDSKLHEEGLLPYYDAYPLVLVIGLYNDGWLGLSLHYLPPKLREFFLKKVLIRNYKLLKAGKPAYVPYKEIKMAGNILHKEGMHIIKRYLSKRVKSKIAEIPYTEWINIVSGEGAKWIDITSSEIYRITKSQILGQKISGKKSAKKKAGISKPAKAGDRYRPKKGNIARSKTIRRKKLRKKR